jgi:hypothetical protein
MISCSFPTEFLTAGSTGTALLSLTRPPLPLPTPAKSPRSASLSASSVVSSSSILASTSSDQAFGVAPTAPLSPSYTSSSSSSSSPFKIFVQVYGHIHVDARWMGSNFNIKKYFHQVSYFPFSDEKVTIPKCSRAGAIETNSCCVFLTPKVELPDMDSAASSNGSLGFFRGDEESHGQPKVPTEYVIQFDLPMDVLPTHRSLCSTVQYTMDICVVNLHRNVVAHSFFPFTVCGGGNAISPYSIK